MTKEELDKCEYWLDTILNEAQDKLNEFEESFIDNIAERLNKGFDLTSKQINLLEKIYDRKTK